jgi:hypothetical protein
MPGTPGIRIALIIALLVSAWVAPAVAANEPCLKLVFGRYCLGGDMAPLLQANPPPIGRQDQGASMALVFTDGPDRVYALGFSGRLYKVVRAFAVSTQLRYDETYAALRDIYGPGEEQSRFPDYATTPARAVGHAQSLARAPRAAGRHGFADTAGAAERRPETTPGLGATESTAGDAP